MLSLVVASILIQVAVFGTTIYLHRTATHRALRLHPAVAWLFRFSLWLTTGLSTREWVAVHRKHHAFTDEEGDPHSPRLMGFWSVQLGNVFLYLKEARNPDVLDRYAKDITDDWSERTLFRHGLLGLVIGTTALCLLIGTGPALLAAGIHATMYVFVLSSSINGLCHHVGYRNFDNTATNLRFLALRDRRRGPAQQPSRVPAQSEIQLPRERVRSGVADHQASHRAEAGDAQQDHRRARAFRIRDGIFTTARVRRDGGGDGGAGGGVARAPGLPRAPSRLRQALRRAAPSSVHQVRRRHRESRAM